MTSMLSSRPSVSKPHDNSVKREQNPHYSHYNGLIPVTAVGVIVGITVAVVATVQVETAKTSKASTKATALETTVVETAVAETTVAETAVAHREPAASETATAKAVTSETATAKAVTSAAKTTTMASAATTASTAAPCERGCAGRRCRYAEHHGRSYCNHLLAHFFKLLRVHCYKYLSTNAPLVENCCCADT